MNAPQNDASLFDRLRRNPLIRFFSSIWFGVTLLALILIYSSAISAIAPIRWYLEMTEMQAFQHPFFVALTILFAVSLLAATFFRTRWTPINIGSLTAHLGLLMLTGGALVYFGTKVEGSVLVQSPMIEVRAAVGDQTGVVGRFRAATGESWGRFLPDTGRAIQLSVVNTEPQGVEPAARANIRVALTGTPPQEVTLRANAPVWQPIGAGLSLRLQTFAPQSAFYDNAIPALYVRNIQTRETRMYRIRNLPIYYEHYLLDEGPLEDSNGRPVLPDRVGPTFNLAGLEIPSGWFERWSMPIQLNLGSQPFQATITGYAPYVIATQPQTRENAPTRAVPVVATPGQRRMDISTRAMSAIRLNLQGTGENADWSDSRWCTFNLYPDQDERPLDITLPDGRQFQLIYSRWQYPLGATIAARNLNVTYFPGQRGIEAYHSQIRVKPTDQPAYDTIVETNQTRQLGQWTLYQSGFSEDHWRYSILGVGNRNGMFLMNVGWVLTVLGSLFAFYVKPVLLRRARARAHANWQQRQPSADADANAA